MMVFSLFALAQVGVYGSSDRCESEEQSLRHSYLAQPWELVVQAAPSLSVVATLALVRHPPVRVLILGRRIRPGTRGPSLTNAAFIIENHGKDPRAKYDFEKAN